MSAAMTVQTNEKGVTKCDGNCIRRHGKHIGEIRRVHVYNLDHDWGYFNYCEQAIIDDEEIGFTVQILEEQ